MDDNLDLQKYKGLLANADKEITKLREQVATCSVTIYETILAQDSQEAEVQELRSRVAELEAILEQSEEHAQAAATVFDAMQGAMGRMQETIKKVADSAKQTVADVGIAEQIDELSKVADSTLDEESLAAYNRQREDLKKRLQGG